MRAADVVLTKPGYGVIAECLANDAALVYTSRGRFLEYQVLVEALPRTRPVGLHQQRGPAGGTVAGCDGGCAGPGAPGRWPEATDGAEFAADRLLSYLV